MTPQVGLYTKEDAEADIATHAALATVHQDAPALIAAHAGLPNVHHTPTVVAYVHLTLDILQNDTQPVTGDEGEGALSNLIDGVPAESGLVYDTIGYQATILFRAGVTLTQLRFYGEAAQSNGRFKIQYLNSSFTWVDWVTDLVCRGASWSDWDSSGGEINAFGLKLICTTVDASGYSRLAELEAKY